MMFDKNFHDYLASPVPLAETIKSLIVQEVAQIRR